MKKLYFLATIILLVTIMTSCARVKAQNSASNQNPAPQTTVSTPNKTVQPPPPPAGAKVENKTPEPPKVPPTNALPSEINPYHPIVFSYKGENNVHAKATFLGASKDGKWFKIEDFGVKCNGKDVFPQNFLDDDSLQNATVDIETMKGKETFKFYSSVRVISEALKITAKPTFFVSPASCQLFLDIKLPSLNEEERFIIGVNGEWNALPRVPKLLQDKKSFSVDVDGDGKDETIRVTESKTSSEGTHNTNAKIELEKNGKKILIEDAKYLDPKAYSVWAVDLNGDGKLEIIIENTGAAGGIIAYEITGDKVNMVLSFDGGE